MEAAGEGRGGGEAAASPAATFLFRGDRLVVPRAPARARAGARPGGRGRGRGARRRRTPGPRGAAGPVAGGSRRGPHTWHGAGAAVGRGSWGTRLPRVRAEVGSGICFSTFMCVRVCGDSEVYTLLIWWGDCSLKREVAFRNPLSSYG